jgi:hypothetical protein
VPITTCSTLTLRNLQKIQQLLRRDAFKTIEPSRAPHAFQPQAPRLDGFHAPIMTISGLSNVATFWLRGFYLAGVKV